MSNKRQASATKSASKPALVPKLRFPEFQKDGAWEIQRLGQSLKFQVGFPFSSSGFNDSRRGLRLIRNRDLRSDDIVKFYSKDFDPSFVVNNGDVLVGMDGDFTPTVWEKGEALLNQRVGRIIPREDNDQRFLLYLLTLSLKGIEEATARTTVKHLSHSVVENKHEPLPSLLEQQKIAACLTSLDDVITAQARKVEVLKAHKKGLMQQLLPRDGETVPRLRFPEFRGAGEWEERALGEVAEFLKGKGISKADIDTTGVLPCIRYGELYTRYGDTITETVSRTNVPATQLLLSEPNDVIIPSSGETKMDIARSACVLYGGVALGGDLNVIRSTLNGSFLSYYLNGTKRFDIARVAQGDTVVHLYPHQLKLLRILIPSIAEQQRIASCLSSLDAQIAAETNNLEMFKTHKKGLMQGLFPVVETSLEKVAG